MPRSGDPKDIKVGTGKANQNSVDANSFTNDLAKGVGGLHGLKAHLLDPKGAHSASAISTTTTFGLYDNDDVQGDLDELSALIPPRPGTVGNYTTNLNTVSVLWGIPDWGVLKLNDAGLISRGLVVPPDPNNPNADANVWPYYNDIPQVASSDPPFSTATANPPDGGNDPSTDPTFNLDPAGTGDPSYKGGGVGLCHEGGFARPNAPGSPVIETMRVFPDAGGAFQPVVVSGALYPADRGVLALLHWPAGGGIGDFLAQPLTDRVVAAIRCGQGILDGCDGAPGGIFTEGDPNWLAYPGRATGQYQLRELHTGLVQGTGAALPAPFNVADPEAGQVRLGTDPNAGVPVVVGGIPILGGTTAATGSGNDNNFFRYRLPYLDDYSAATGLAITPAAERFRYFDKPAVALDYLVDLTEAGDYPNFTQTYWEFQVARYRHLFNFLSNAPLADPKDQGSWILVHFKREADFEAYARDGILPDDVTDGYEVYSADLLDWGNPESTDNLAAPATPNDTSSGYHVTRAAVWEDPVDLETIITLGIGYTYARTLDEVVAVSGIKYFVPGSAGSKWTITDLNLSVSNVWTNDFRLGSGATSVEITPGLDHQNPMFLYFGMHGVESGSMTAPSVTTSFAGTVEGDENSGGQRIEFRYDELDFASGHGAFDLTNSPLPTDNADLLLVPGDPMTFNGDVSNPHFSTEARLGFRVRPPLGHQDSTDSVRGGQFPNPLGAKILFHTTQQNPTDTTGDYGNFQTAGPGTPARAALETASKDVQERFLDEVYRWSVDAVFTGAEDPTWDGAKGNLAGPGLPFGLAGVLDLPVRVGGDVTYAAISFIQLDLFTADLAAAGPVDDEAQVAGLPNRNPPVSDGIISPLDYRGILLYPTVDYTAGFRPSNGAGDITSTQFDYSTIVTPTREYIRMLDAGYSRDAAPKVDVVTGQPFFRVRVHGLQLADFAYSAPGPGGTEIAIYVKVPGLTTWMDLGRTDGAGPSKQDPLTDGAGCQVAGPLTINGRDPKFGHVYADVRVNVGPSANLFTNFAGEVPVLLRVLVKSGSTLDWTQTGPNTTIAPARGLIGVEILRPE